MTCEKEFRYQEKDIVSDLFFSHLFIYLFIYLSIYLFDLNNTRQADI